MFRPAQSGHLQVYYDVTECSTVCNAYKHVYVNLNQVSSLYYYYTLLHHSRPEDDPIERVETCSRFRTTIK